MAALAEAAGMVHPDPPCQVGGPHRRLERSVHAEPVAVDRRAPLAAGADEDVSLVDGHALGKYPSFASKVPGLLSPPQPYYPARSGALRTQSVRARSNSTGKPIRMISNEVGKLLTATEVAEMLHLHVNTVKRLGDRGEIPFYRVCKRGDRRFRYDDVLDFLRRAK